ncbi:MAG: GEVED domain-containing protein [Chloroflexota bacterium]
MNHDSQNYHCSNQFLPSRELDNGENAQLKAAPTTEESTCSTVGACLQPDKHGKQRYRRLAEVAQLQAAPTRGERVWPIVGAVTLRDRTNVARREYHRKSQTQPHSERSKKEVKTGMKETRTLHHFGAVATLGLLLTIALLVSALSPATTFAQQATTPNTEIVLSVSYDGTALFSDADPLNDGNGAHTPGLDLNANNNVVRTFDTIGYRVDWNVNEVDATGVSVDVQLPAAIPEVVWTEIPPGCDLTLSTISADGQTLTCLLGDAIEGTSGTFFPVAEVASTRVGIDGDVIETEASIVTDQTTGNAVTSDAVSTTISAGINADWLKGIATEYTDIQLNGTDGRIYVYPIVLAPDGDGRGVEPLNDAVAIQLFDHLYRWTGAAGGSTNAINATLITSANVANVTGEYDGQVCGGYTGAGTEALQAGTPFYVPYGLNGLGDATNTTAGAAAGTETIACTDATGGNSYPIIQFDISGHDTVNIAEKSVAGNGNSTIVIAAQVAFFLADGDLFPNGNEQGYLHNAITGDTTAVGAPAADATPNTTVTSIAVAGPISGAESTTENNAVAAFIAAVPSVAAGFSFEHWVQMIAGPYSQIQVTDPNTGMPLAAVNELQIDKGGPGFNLFVKDDDNDNQNWDFVQFATRDQVVTIETAVSTVDPNGYADAVDFPIHSCTRIDTTFMELIDFPSTFDVVEVNFTNLRNSGTTIVGSSTGTPTNGIAHLLLGDTHNDHLHTYRAMNGVRINPAFTPQYEIQVATAAVSVQNTYGVHATTCNDADAVGGAAGWVTVNSGTDLSAFDGNNDGRYEGIQLVRVRLLDPVKWASPFPAQNRLESTGSVAFTTENAGAAFRLYLQAQMKDNLIDAADGSQIQVHASRASREWPAANAAPSTTNCTDTGAYGADNGVIPNGWCNLPSASPVEEASGNPQAAHRDLVTIGSPQLDLQKQNVAGLADQVENGDLVVFTIDIGVSGAPVAGDALGDVQFVDTLPANLAFVSINPGGGSCATGSALSSGVFTCTFGTQQSPWTDTITLTTRVVEAGANQSLINNVLGTAVYPAAGGAGAETIEVNAAAGAYTGDGYHKLEIRKNVPDINGPCINPPGSTQLPPEDCSLIDVNGQMTFTLHYSNTGNVDLTNVSIIDLFPHLDDEIEAQTTFSGTPASAGDLGDGRTPESLFSGTTSLVSVVESNGSTIVYTTDAATGVNRDPAANTNTWGAFDAAATAFSTTVASLAAGQSGQISIVLDTDGNEIDDIYTNNFGVRSADILLTNRSNDVSVMPSTCEHSRLHNNAMNVSGSSIASQTISSVSDNAYVAVHNCGVDYGDLPDGNATNSPNYATLITTTVASGNAGPSHVIVDGLYLGSLVDGESDGQPNITATGDDVVTGTVGAGTGVGAGGNAGDDEDGITFPTFNLDQSATITATVVNTRGVDAYLYTFIDWNGDGTFSGPDEVISQTVASNTAAQSIAIVVNVPAAADTTQQLGARFRLSTDTGLGADGAATDGEVEDYLIEIESLESLALEKTLISPANGMAMLGDTLTFQLQITNTGLVTVTELNLVDRYDPAILQYISASITPDSQVAGTITWASVDGDGSSLDANLPLAPGVSFIITVDFEVIAPTRP